MKQIDAFLLPDLAHLFGNIFVIFFICDMCSDAFGGLIPGTIPMWLRAHRRV